MSPDQLSSHTTAHPTSPHLVISLLIYSSLQEKRPFSDVTWHPVDLLEDFPCYDSPPVPITSVTAHHNSLPPLVAVILSNTFFLNSRFVFIWQFTSKASPGEWGARLSFLLMLQSHVSLFLIFLLMPTVKGTRGNGENLRLNYLKDTAFYFKILFKLLGQTKVFIDFFFFLLKLFFLLFLLYTEDLFWEESKK